MVHLAYTESLDRLGTLACPASPGLTAHPERLVLGARQASGAIEVTLLDRRAMQEQQHQHQHQHHMTTKRLPVQQDHPASKVQQDHPDFQVQQDHKDTGVTPAPPALKEVKVNKGSLAQ